MLRLICHGRDKAGYAEKEKLISFQRNSSGSDHGGMLANLGQHYLSGQAYIQHVLYGSNQFMAFNRFAQQPGLRIHIPDEVAGIA